MSVTTASPRDTTASAATAVVDPARAALKGTRRPRRSLLLYYALQSILTGPAILVVLPVRIFRFRTLRYEFDPDGVTMRWGILFRREVSLTYARIQDIHLVSNVVERWLGLGRVQVQTASGNSAAEMTIEGLPDFEQVRDELYARMRGARGARSQPPSTALAVTSASSGGELAAVADALIQATTELRALRALLEKQVRP
ncbi:MAG: PH domain-containing protein [Longimicrobiales bacterium]